MFSSILNFSQHGSVRKSRSSSSTASSSAASETTVPPPRPPYVAAHKLATKSNSLGSSPKAQNKFATATSPQASDELVKVIRSANLTARAESYYGLILSSNLEFTALARFTSHRLVPLIVNQNGTDSRNSSPFAGCRQGLPRLDSRSTRIYSGRSVPREVYVVRLYRRNLDAFAVRMLILRSLHETLGAFISFEMSSARNQNDSFRGTVE